MLEKERTPIAFFIVTDFHFVCPDCIPEDTKARLTFYDKEEIVGYYNDLHIGFQSQEHETTSEGDSLVVTCQYCNKNLAEGKVTHDLSDMFVE